MKRKFSILIALAITVQIVLGTLTIPVMALQNIGEEYQLPETPSVTYNLNMDWKFKKPEGNVFPLQAASTSVVKNGKQFYEVGYDDSDWESVSVPHPVNASDSFDSQIVDAGEQGLYRGFMFYRKNFTLPATDAGKKLFVEFESIRQSAYVYVNGEMVGYYEAGITAIGFDITDYVKYGEENLIAVATDNASSRGSSFNTQETRPGNTPGDLSGNGYQWNTKDFNPTQGGIVGNVLLYAKSDVYQTLPLYNNLKTRGNYIYGSNFNIKDKTATINVEAEVRNESNQNKNITLEVNVVDHDGNLAYTFSQTAPVNMANDKGVAFKTVLADDVYSDNPAKTNADTVDVTVIRASANVADLRFWNIEDPYLYSVYTILKDGDTVLDTQEIKTGFRKVDYNGTDGLLINDRKVFLTGYAQRATNEWAAVGVANDWLNDIDMQLVREANSNFIRWMHIAPRGNVVRSGDKYGVVSVVPAGDKESDATGRAWNQRVEAMRDAIIYFRNSPSVIYWEAGNNVITAEHMQEMTDLKQVLDPNGGRYMGSRTLQTVDQINAAEYVGTMLNRHAANAKASMVAANKMMGIMETEYHREESPRRVWDDFSPPDYDYDNKWLGSGASKTDGFDIHDLTSEDFVLTDAKSFEEFYNDRVGGSSGKDLYSSIAALVWADSNQHGRNSGSENARMSGRVDPVRIKKQSFYAYQVMQSTEPKIHIVGHWNYPQVDNDKNYKYALKEFNGTYWAKTGQTAYRDPTKKTVYVVGTTDVVRMELYVNDQLVGTDRTADNTFIYAFPNVDVTQSGKVEAFAYNARDEVIATHKIETAGSLATIRLTPVTGPDGLVADGSDIMYYDIEAVDADGRVLPLNYDKVNFELTGNGTFLGGYNSGKFGENAVIHKNFVFMECGTNRVFIRSTPNAGPITLKASMEGILPVTATIESKELQLTGGLTTQLQRSFKQGEMPPMQEIEAVAPLRSLAGIFKAIFGVNTKVVEEIGDEKVYYTVEVNGEAVDFGENVPFEQSGVFGPVMPVLDKLKSLGAEFSYTYNEGKKELTLIADGKTIIATVGKTTLQVDDEVNADLLGGQPEFYNDTFYMEINSLVKYVPGISQIREGQTHKITFSK